MSKYSKQCQKAILIFDHFLRQTSGIFSYFFTIDSSKGIKAASFVFENKGKLKEFYRIGKLIGSGAFGDVRIWLHKESNSQRAVKILYKANMTEEDERMLINEINILRDLDHPNIVKMYEFFQDEKRYYIITE